MGKGVGRFYKKIQQNFQLLCPNTTIVVTLHYVLLSHHDRTNDFSDTLTAHINPSPVSHLTTTNQVDTYNNSYDDTQNFATLENAITNS